MNVQIMCRLRFIDCRSPLILLLTAGDLTDYKPLTKYRCVIQGPVPALIGQVVALRFSLTFSYELYSRTLLTSIKSCMEVVPRAGCEFES